MNFKKIKQEREKTKVEKRIAVLPVSELLPWSEQAIYSLGRNLSSWQKTQDKFYLDEAKVAAEVVHAITEELYKRTANAKQL